MVQNAKAPLLSYRYLCGIYIPLALNLKPKRVEYPSTLAAMYDCAVEDDKLCLK